MAGKRLGVMRFIFFLLAVAGWLIAQPSLYAQGEITIRWYGHAFFITTSADGVRIAADPFSDIGYRMPNVEAELVTVSHDHGDHNNPQLIKGKPRILRGLEMGGRHWAWVDFRQKDVRIKAFPAYHDKVEGKERGLNTIFLLEVSGLRIVHMSDIGHIPPETTLKALEKVDVLFIPVGGVYSIDAKEASHIVERLKPAIVIPMHYKTPVTAKWPISDERPFIQGKPRVKQVGNTIRIRREGLPRETEVWVMDYR